MSLVLAAEHSLVRRLLEVFVTNWTTAASQGPCRWLDQYPHVFSFWVSVGLDIACSSFLRNTSQSPRMRGGGSIGGSVIGHQIEANSDSDS